MELHSQGKTYLTVVIENKKIPRDHKADHHKLLRLICETARQEFRRLRRGRFKELKTIPNP